VAVAGRGRRSLSGTLAWIEAAAARHPVRVQYATRGAIALVAIAIAWAFAVTVLRHTRPMGLPLDDSYVYLTYAKQLGRGQPFTYAPGGGDSAGAASVLWPMVLAPLWALGARGHALVWASFVVSAALYVATALGVSRIVQQIAGGVAGVLAPVVLFAIAPFAWTALSGLEVALASALLVTAIRLLLAAPPTGAPGRPLAACLAAVSLARPEAILIVAVISGAAAIDRLRRRERAAAAWWLAPLAAPAVWLAAHRLLAGHWLPNPSIASSHFSLPGFDWTFWRGAVWTLTGRMFRGVFWDQASPLVWPRLFAVLWLAGAIRVIAWARRERRRLAGAVIVLAPLVVMLAVVASSGLWSFQNYRYLAPAFPLLVISAGCALGPARAGRARVGTVRAVRAVWAVGAVGLAGGLGYAAIPRLVADARLFAQGAMDTNTQVVAIGEYLHRKLPDAHVMLQEPGAIAYYGDVRIDDVLAVVTTDQLGVANHGPGAQLELLDGLAPERRFTHFACYPRWLGTDEWFGEVVLATPLRPGIGARRFAGGAELQLIAASWDHAGTGERPLGDHAGWSIADRIDIADLASEAAHTWAGALGRRALEDPPARWSVIGREAGAHGLILDGGRTIRGGGERFTIAIDPGKPSRLVLRTGGARAYPANESIEHPVPLRILDAVDREVARATLPAPAAGGAFAEVTFALPAGTSPVLHTEASAPYRAFHWFVLQPE
jgi:hypothetical protein